MYAKISKIRKQKLDKIESEVLQIKQEISNLKKRLDEVYEMIDSLEVPKSGDMSVFGTFVEEKRVLGNQKDSILRALHVKEMELAKKYQEYKKANIEYEKIKYLEELEIKKSIEKAKKLEQKELDDISGMLFKKEERF